MSRKPFWQALYALLISLLVFSNAHAAPELLPAPEPEPLSKAEIERVLTVLEDPKQREEITTLLRALSEASESQTDESVGNSVKTAAAELLEMLA